MAFIAPIIALAGGMSTIATGATIASGLVGAAGAIGQGYATQQVEQYNAKSQQIQAQAAEAQAANKYAEISDRTRAGMAQATAAGLESGFDNSGSFRDWVLSSGSKGYSDALSSIYEGNVKATGYRNNATAAMFMGDQAVTAGYMGAGAKVLGSVADIYKTKGKGAFGPSWDT